MVSAMSPHVLGNMCEATVSTAEAATTDGLYFVNEMSRYIMKEKKKRKRSQQKYSGVSINTSKNREMKEIVSQPRH